MKQVKTSIVLGPDDKRRMEQLADKLGISQSAAIRMALRKLYEREGLRWFDKPTKEQA